MMPTQIVRTRNTGRIILCSATLLLTSAALAQSPGGMSTIADRLAWPALLRKLDRIDPSFRN